MEVAYVFYECKISNRGILLFILPDAVPSLFFMKFVVFFLLQVKITRMIH